jgi:hypothetical protein
MPAPAPDPYGPLRPLGDPSEALRLLYRAHLDDITEANREATLATDKSRGAADDALYQWRLRSGWFVRHPHPKPAPPPPLFPSFKLKPQPRGGQDAATVPGKL